MEDHTDWSFTANFSDIDGDGDGDLPVSSDHETSQVLLNNGDGTFSNITDREVIVDQAGMGGAVGDFDNDGDMDWFVTSIYNLDTGEGGLLFGNRLYRNDGDGVFADVTDDSATRDGAWGWGACAADFDNGTRIDLAHVNGWRGYFRNDRSDVQKDYSEARSVRGAFRDGQRDPCRRHRSMAGRRDDRAHRRRCRSVTDHQTGVAIAWSSELVS